MLVKAFKLCLFGLAILLGLVGCFLAFDAFVPKERSISLWILAGEFLVGVVLLGLAVCLGRKGSKPNH